MAELRAAPLPASGRRAKTRPMTAPKDPHASRSRSSIRPSATSPATPPRCARRAPRRRGLGADVVMFPELFLAGYPPEDLVLKPAFQDVCREACEALARETGDGGPAVLVGLPWAEDGKLYNAYALLDAGQIAALRFKVDLPNYGVFDEKRVFTPGPLPGPVVIRGVRIGMPVCEDIWGDEIVECITETGGEILLVPNGSPYWRGKTDERMNIAVARVAESGLPLVYLNQVGGQDELVFDGASFVVNADGALACQLPAFREAVALTRLGEGRRGLALPRGAARIGRGRRRGRLCRLRARASRLCRQEPLSGRGARAFRRHRFGALRRDRGRRARSRPRALRHAALPLHLERVAVRRRRMRRAPRRPLRHGADRRAGRRLRGGAEAAVCRQARATSPRRTSRPAPAARS